MSKESEARARQKYQAHPLKRRCRECAHFKADYKSYWVLDKDFDGEKNRRCGLGGFAVTPNAICDEFRSLRD